MRSYLYVGKSQFTQRQSHSIRLMILVTETSRSSPSLFADVYWVDHVFALTAIPEHASVRELVRHAHKTGPRIVRTDTSLVLLPYACPSK